MPSLLGRLVEAQWLHSYGLWGELAPVSAVAVIFGASLYAPCPLSVTHRMTYTIADLNSPGSWPSETFCGSATRV